MKPLIDALDELIKAYENDVECHACHGTGLHTDDCPWRIVVTWTADCNSIMDSIKAKAGVRPDIRPGDSSLPAELRERK